MTLRAGVAALMGLLVFGCPAPESLPDSSVPDASNPPPLDACSGGCAPNLICDTRRRICVDPCGGCDAGACMKQPSGSYSCQPVVVSCNGTACDQGHVACVAGSCACFAAVGGAKDSCRDVGQWCGLSRRCRAPERYEECSASGPPCPTGHRCSAVFGDTPVCVRDCGASSNVCDRGELCGRLANDAFGCLPQGMFRRQECVQHALLADGGLQRDSDGGLLLVTVPESNTCLLKTGDGDIVDPPGVGTGNCTYTLMRLWDDGALPIRTCRPPGSAAVGQPCRRDLSSAAIATQCATGSECALTRGSDGGVPQGICLTMCNANPPRSGYTPLPACQPDSACVNLYRRTDPNDNAVVGACMKKCQVFSTDGGQVCPPMGEVASSCVPVGADGVLAVSPDGTGVCVPQQPTVAPVGGPCGEIDPFRGATCESGQVCTALSSSDQPRCIAVCDLECNPSDGGIAPLRCQTQPNARCVGSATCRRVSSTPGARVGYCL